MFFEEWPDAQLPQDLPKYPDGKIEADAEPGDVVVRISDTSEAVFLEYMSALKTAGWNFVDPAQQYNGQAYQEQCLLQYGYNNGDVTLQFMTEQ